MTAGPGIDPFEPIASFGPAAIIRAVGLVVVGVALVAASAFVIDSRRAVSTDFGTLQAPVTTVDIERAELARQVAASLAEVRGPAPPTSVGYGREDRGGFRGSGYGWFFRHDQGWYGGSIAADIGFVEPVDRHAEGDLLITSCGGRWVVHVRSSVEVEDAHRDFRQLSGCPPLADAALSGPIMFVVSGVEP